MRRVLFIFAEKEKKVDGGKRNRDKRHRDRDTQGVQAHFGEPDPGDEPSLENNK